MLGSRPMYSSPTFRPPTNATRPSTTTILRWLRKLIWNRFRQPPVAAERPDLHAGRGQFAVECARRRTLRLPISSYRKSTRTPSGALRISRVFSSRPSWSSRTMKNWTRM